MPKNARMFRWLSILKNSVSSSCLILTGLRSIGFKRIAYLLVHSYGIKPGDRVAIYAANAPEWIIFFWATVGIGAIACGLNGWWKGEEAINAIN